VRVYLAIDGDGSAFLCDERPRWQDHGQEWTWNGRYRIPFTGDIPFVMAARECREVEIDVVEIVDTKSYAPRLPERATTKIGRPE
jgi:hypothetical protein